MAGLLVVLATTGAASTTSSLQAVEPGHHGPPPEVLGLTVQKEDLSKTLAGEKRPLYVDRVGLYSFREPNKLLQGTLQIAHFRPDAPSGSSDFQLSIVGHLGNSLPIVVRVGSQPVYITTSKGLVLAVWFHKGYMLALSIRRSYGQPKELLRQALAIDP